MSSIGTVFPNSARISVVRKGSWRAVRILNIVLVCGKKIHLESVHLKDLYPTGRAGCGPGLMSLADLGDVPGTYPPLRVQILSF